MLSLVTETHHLIPPSTHSAFISWDLSNMSPAKCLPDHTLGDMCPIQQWPWKYAKNRQVRFSFDLLISYVVVKWKPCASFQSCISVFYHIPPDPIIHSQYLPRHWVIKYSSGRRNIIPINCLDYKLFLMQECSLSINIKRFSLVNIPS